MPTKRRTGAAAVSRVGVSAGTIDSSSGSASVTPAPRRNVRRGMCFLAMNIGSLLALSAVAYAQFVLASRRFSRIWNCALLHDPQHDRREPVVVASRRRAQSRGPSACRCTPRRGRCA